MSYLIGLGYKMRQGKDTVAQAIIDARGEQYGIVRRGFADALKEETTDAAMKVGGMLALFTQLATQLPPWVKYNPDPPMDDPLCPLGKQRYLLQWYGSEFRRSQDPFYWVRRMDEWIALKQPRVVLIPDMRFKNEFFYIQPRGTTAKVSRQGYFPLDGDDHASEHDLDGSVFDYDLNCADGELDELKKDAVLMFDLIVKSMNPVGVEV